MSSQYPPTKLRASAKRQHNVPVTPPQTRSRQKNTDEATHIGLTPRSAIRYRPYVKQYIIPLDNGTAMRVTEQELDDLPPEYQQVAQLDLPQPAVTSAAPIDEHHTDEAFPITTRTKHRRISHPHWLLIFVIGMIAMLALWAGLSLLVSWVNVKLDDMTYGYPRTWQTDAVVGHSDSPTSPSHFIFLNLNRHVEIIEFPGGDASHARIFIGPTLFGDNDNLTPITGEVRDVDGDGKPDLVIHIHDQRIVFINDNGTFRPLKPGEHVTFPSN